MATQPAAAGREPDPPGSVSLGLQHSGCESQPVRALGQDQRQGHGGQRPLGTEGLEAQRGVTAVSRSASGWSLAQQMPTMDHSDWEVCPKPPLIGASGLQTCRWDTCLSLQAPGVWGVATGRTGWSPPALGAVSTATPLALFAGPGPTRCSDHRVPCPVRSPVGPSTWCPGHRIGVTLRCALPIGSPGPGRNQKRSPRSMHTWGPLDRPAQPQCPFLDSEGGNACLTWTE